MRLLAFLLIAIALREYLTRKPCNPRDHALYLILTAEDK